MLTRQCWDTRTYLSTLRQLELGSLVECPTSGTTWLEMANYGGSNVMLVRNESSAESLVAMLASCSPVGLQVQRGGGGLEDAVVSCGQKRSYYPTFEASGEEPGEEDFGDDCTQHVESKKRRLSFDQVKSLEKNFEIENKLEPERKIQLAKELGLQPRQVAVWFQNRRARWKTKQLERDYEVLVLDYNRLKTEFEAVLQEKQELEGEVESLTEKTHTAELGPVDLPEKSKRSKASCHLSPEKACEGSVKLEKIKVELNAGNGGLTAPCKEEDTKETSSESVSSEILNADSPRTMDSSGSLLPLDNINTYPQISAEMVDSTIIHMSDNLYEQMLSPHTCPRVSVKLEDGSFQDESCNYILAQLDSIEEKGLPWWDWP